MQVVLDFRVAQRAKVHMERLAVALLRAGGAIIKRKAGIKSNNLTTRLTQLFNAIFKRVRFAGNGIIQHANLIAANNQMPGIFFP